MSLFSGKLDGLPATIQRAVAVSPGSLAKALAICRGQAVAVVGSGGSAATGALLGFCRMRAGFGTGLVMTPMDYVFEGHGHSGRPAWLLSASGSNPDILAACEAACRTRACFLGVLSSRRESALTEASAAHPNSQIHVAPVADPEDGFLATHSVMSAAALLLKACSARARRDPSGFDAVLLKTTRRLIGTESRDALKERVRPTAERDTIIVLHDPACRPAATLLETCLWEAGIAGVQRTDMRNFAHGRHAWLARHKDRTLILCMSTDRSRGLWVPISASLPPDLPQMSWHFGEGDHLDVYESMLVALLLVEAMAACRGIDPARPPVLSFPRRLADMPELLLLARDLPRPNGADGVQAQP